MIRSALTDFLKQECGLWFSRRLKRVFRGFGVSVEFLKDPAGLRKIPHWDLTHPNWGSLSTNWDGSLVGELWTSLDSKLNSCCLGCGGKLVSPVSHRGNPTVTPSTPEQKCAPAASFPQQQGVITQSRCCRPCRRTTEEHGAAERQSSDWSTETAFYLCSAQFYSASLFKPEV